MTSSASKPPPRQPKPWILFLAFELLDEIAQYISDTPSDLTSFMLSCRQTAFVAESVRYTTITVEGSPGRKLLSTLLSGSPTANRYLLKISRIWYRGWYDCEIFLLSSLLCEVLHRTSNLRTLWLNIDPAGCAQLTDCMKRLGLMRIAHHPATILRDIHLGADASSPLNLPNLLYLRITGAFQIANIAAHRYLSELEMHQVLNHEEFAKFISTAEDGHLGSSLETLSIKLNRTLDTCLTLPILSHAFPNLRNLALDKSSLVVKARRYFFCHHEALLTLVQEVLSLLAAETPVFRCVRNLVLNRRYACRALKRGLSSPCGEYEGLTRSAMDQQLEEVAARHRRLVRIGIGRNLFELNKLGTFQHTLLDFSSTEWDRIFGVQFSASCISGAPPRHRRRISTHFGYTNE
ncbi:hypothetical protein DFP72DRAFT_1081880 [Ephemerocybe angulata]|uniref:Uncharacterized protein n=1 Tax=Ephemerocybe angulata TaxID=980116 RepID=A0A8H6HAZ1_9AGAR|nr:hypothetical protein DFP72DRAFT_1081880 [Tulosesus angulatus]